MLQKLIGRNCVKHSKKVAFEIRTIWVKLKAIVLGWRQSNGVAMTSCHTTCHNFWKHKIHQMLGRATVAMSLRIKKNDDVEKVTSEPHDARTLEIAPAQ